MVEDGERNGGSGSTGLVECWKVTSSTPTTIQPNQVTPESTRDLFLELGDFTEERLLSASWIDDR